jgi:hypothetical protein
VRHGGRHPVKVAEAIVAAAFAALGVRSLVYWLRRPFETADLRDHLLFAAYLTGRVGLWFSIGALFLLLSLDTGTRFAGGSSEDFARYASRYGWYVMVFAGLSALQLVAGYFLGRRADGAERFSRRP